MSVALLLGILGWLSETFQEKIICRQGTTVSSRYHFCRLKACGECWEMSKKKLTKIKDYEVMKYEIR